MAHYKYKTQKTCSTYIDFDLEDGAVTNVSFTNGCNGNLKAVSKLVNGMSVEKIEEYLKGNLCGNRGTSCADQLAIAVRMAQDGELEAAE